MHDHDSAASALAAVTLISLLVVVGVLLGLGLCCCGWRRALFVAACIGTVFQLGHFAEHVAQAGYWARHPSEAPWMTPWAGALANSFGALAPRTPGFGMEAMHLVGNAIFLSGAAAVLAVLSRIGSTSSKRLARTGVVVQTVHVAEHVALTVSVALSGRAIGVSTLFGTLDPGRVLWAYRVWWHLTINAMATTMLLLAIARRSRAQEAVATVSRTPALARS